MVASQSQLFGFSVRIPEPTITKKTPIGQEKPLLKNYGSHRHHHLSLKKWRLIHKVIEGLNSRGQRCLLLINLTKFKSQRKQCGMQRHLTDIYWYFGPRFLCLGSIRMCVYGWVGEFVCVDVCVCACVCVGPCGWVRVCACVRVCAGVRFSGTPRSTFCSIVEISKVFLR